MSKQTPKQEPKRAGSPDRLTKTSKKGSIELTEQELDGISGGPTAVELKYLKID